MKAKELSPVMIFPIIFSSFIVSVFLIKYFLPEMPTSAGFALSLFINLYLIYVKKRGFLAQVKEDIQVFGSVTYIGKTLFENKQGWICLTKTQVLFIQNPSRFGKATKYSYSLLDIKLLETESNINNSKVKNILKMTLVNGEVVKLLAYQPNEWIEDIQKAKLALDQDQLILEAA